jgi:hypothetical protein
MPYRTSTLEVLDENLEHIREGTREQYESEWLFFPSGARREVRHNLGEIPWVVSVVRSDDATGSVVERASWETLEDPWAFGQSANVRIAYADIDGTTGSGINSLTLTNNMTTSVYFKVRAM